MREIIFDTETTGLDNQDDRIIEFGGVELVNRFPTGRTFHVFINPQGRSVHPEALAVHGISDAQLVGEPTFEAISAKLLDFIEDATLIAHNANFDIGFLNAEFARLGVAPVDPSLVVDTLAIARRKHPMGPNSLDALCRRYGIDNSHRTKHGALLDSELLAEVYIELIGGKQAALSLEVQSNAVEEQGDMEAFGTTTLVRPRPLAPRLSEADLAAHRELVAELGSEPIWAKIDPEYAKDAEAA
ncbi:DNA polymerase III subunit epsilon [Aquamicrobium sp. LC103]|uniref:DNA polymerase III subunit epsilon n=1 Tax=Aquamicrobium sp. LC103 TaxID=1120658 RepID=UPI00063E7A05|nr:DNA polymerase III subunit epsilon [Aquamicrobium sp. LC103]TKT82802.1 DNA polymerase III subunit epsilon [Aquamicrobium sp. LC103]